ncbi:Protein kinase domain-containing protein [Aphelenchoides bicaudatus]|nr:Protein kinase domain-containing protein [Aphelenchoides bicaudatus]
MSEIEESDPSDEELLTAQNGEPATKKSRKSKITTEMINRIRSTGGTLTNLPAHLKLAGQFNLLKDTDGNEICWTCIECDNKTGYHIGSTQSATKHLTKKHPEGNEVCWTCIECDNKTGYHIGSTQSATGCPCEYIEILRYVDNLRYYDQPDYKEIYTALRRSITALGAREYPYDWEVKSVKQTPSNRSCKKQQSG